MAFTGSDLWKLTIGDFIRGLIVAVISGVLTLFLVVLQTGGKVDLKTIGTVALTALIAYLLKNLGTDANGDILGKIKVMK